MSYNTELNRARISEPRTGNNHDVIGAGIIVFFLWALWKFVRGQW